MKSHVLVVEDDKFLADVLAYNLEQAGYKVSVARDGQDGLKQAEVKIPDLIVLDLMLPIIDGLEVCRRLRGNALTRDVLIVIVTAKSEEFDQVIGFSMGADDYVSKPFSIRVLLERIKGLLRRRDGQTTDHDIVASQGVTVDRRGHRVKIDDKSLDLTPSEFGLIDVMIRQPGRAFTRAELIDAALGDDTFVLERTVDVHIRALRQKLGNLADVIQTVRGVGYRFRDTREN